MDQDQDQNQNHTEKQPHEKSKTQKEQDNIRSNSHSPLSHVSSKNARDARDDQKPAKAPHTTTNTPKEIPSADVKPTLKQQSAQQKSQKEKDLAAALRANIIKRKQAQKRRVDEK